MEDYPDSLLSQNHVNGEHKEPVKHEEVWTADRLWRNEVNALRLMVSELLENDPNLLRLYNQEVQIAKHTDQAAAQDTIRYIGFPIVEAAFVINRVREIVNNPEIETDLDYGWLNLSGVELKDPEEKQAKLSTPFSEPRYRPMDVLIEEVKVKTGIELNREVHDELSANQTQYFISVLLIDATDIDWRARDTMS